VHAALPGISVTAIIAARRKQFIEVLVFIGISF
jgi:hypothetical protein